MSGALHPQDEGCGERRGTAGPWHVIRMNAKDGFLVIGTVGPFGPKKHIAEMVWPKSDNDAFADAMLIMAAPDMYDALVALNAGARPVNWDDEDLDPGERDAWRQLDAALAKARSDEQVPA